MKPNQSIPKNLSPQNLIHRTQFTPLLAVILFTLLSFTPLSSALISATLLQQVSSATSPQQPQQTLCLDLNRFEFLGFSNSDSLIAKNCLIGLEVSSFLFLLMFLEREIYQGEQVRELGSAIFYINSNSGILCELYVVGE